MSIVRRAFNRWRGIKSIDRLKLQKNVIDVSAYDDTFGTAKGVLKVAGLRLMRQDTPLVKQCWNVFYWFSFFNMAFVTGLELVALAQTIQQNEYSEFFRMMPVIGYMFLAMSKSYKITYRREVFENIISELRSMWPRGELSDEEYSLVRGGLKHFRYALGSHYLTVVLSFIFSYPPVVIIIKTALGMEAEKMYLPYLYWLPFDPFQSLEVYSIMIAIETFHCVTTVWAMMAADLLFCIFLNHITIQLNLLSLRIRKLFYVPVNAKLIESYTQRIYSKDMKRNLADGNTGYLQDRRLQELNAIIKRHQILIRLAKDVEDMFTFALLINLMNSSVIICFCGLCTVFIEEWSDPHYKAFLLVTLLQNWITCWYGQRIIDASTGVVEALYCSGWYRTGKKVRSSILIMMHRSQKELHVTAYGFSVISLSTFTMILKSSWSYFTLLINIMK